MIVLCHIVHYYSFLPAHEIIGNFFDCGVQLFIYISGYLYGLRIISGFRKFYYKRIVSIALPAVLVSIFTIIALSFAGDTISIQSVVAYSLDLEGLLFLNWSFFETLFSQITSLGPLWFTTIIMLCYLLIPLLQRVYNVVIIKKHYTVFLIIFIIVGLLLCIILRSYINISCFLWFAIGYFTGRIRILDRIRLKHFVFYSILFVVVITVRLVLHRYYDDTDLYLTYCMLSHFVLGTTVVVVYSFLNNRFSIAVSYITNSKIIRALDNYSYYIYLVHGVFYIGTFNFYVFLPLHLATVFFVSATVAGAFVIKILSDAFQKVLIK